MLLGDGMICEIEFLSANLNTQSYPYLPFNMEVFCKINQEKG